MAARNPKTDSNQTQKILAVGTPQQLAQFLSLVQVRSKQTAAVARGATSEEADVAAPFSELEESSQVLADTNSKGRNTTNESSFALPAEKGTQLGDKFKANNSERIQVLFFLHSPAQPGSTNAK